jgi:hypothetical protein
MGSSQKDARGAEGGFRRLEPKDLARSRVAVYERCRAELLRLLLRDAPPVNVRRLAEADN